MAVKILIVDDHELVRETLLEIIKHIGGHLKSIGVAPNGKEAVEFAKNQKPDIIIMDIDMLVMDGIEATREIKRLYLDVGIIAYSMSDERWKVKEMIEAGAKGYLLKTSTYQELDDAIKKVFNEEYCFTKEIAKHLPPAIS